MEEVFSGGRALRERSRSLEFVARRLVRLRSVYVKFGQYLGGRADMVPAEWSAELRALQDDLPACPASHGRRTLRAEFGKAGARRFTRLDYAPIASASVAQVHVARVRDAEAAGSAAPPPSAPR